MTFIIRTWLLSCLNVYSLFIYLWSEFLCVIDLIVTHLLRQWTFHPFIFKTKKIYTVLMWCRVLAFLVVSALFLYNSPSFCFVSQFSIESSFFHHYYIYGLCWAKDDFLLSSDKIHMFVRCFQHLERTSTYVFYLLIC